MATEETDEEKQQRREAREARRVERQKAQRIIKIQRQWRSAIARRTCHRIAQTVIERIRDPAIDKFFYYNIRLHRSRWTKPMYVTGVARSLRLSARLCAIRGSGAAGHPLAHHLTAVRLRP